MNNWQLLEKVKRAENDGEYILLFCSAASALKMFNELRHLAHHELIVPHPAATAAVLLMEATQNCVMVRCLLPHSLLRMASARCKPLKPPLQSFNSLSAAKISSAARGGLQRLAAHDILHGERRAEKGCR